MQKIATLTGHTYRVLYLSMSPDGQSIVTGAGDETLRFWNVFPSVKGKSDSFPYNGGVSSLLFPSSMDISLSKRSMLIRNSNILPNYKPCAIFSILNV